MTNERRHATHFIISEADIYINFTSCYHYKQISIDFRDICVTNYLTTHQIRKKFYMLLRFLYVGSARVILCMSQFHRDCSRASSSSVPRKMNSNNNNTPTTKKQSRFEHIHKFVWKCIGK